MVAVVVVVVLPLLSISPYFPFFVFFFFFFLPTLFFPAFFLVSPNACFLLLIVAALTPKCSAASFGAARWAGSLSRSCVCRSCGRVRCCRGKIY